MENSRTLGFKISISKTGWLLLLSRLCWVLFICWMVLSHCRCVSSTPLDVGKIVNNQVEKYEDARRSTIKAWETVIGRVSDICYARSQNAIVIETGRFPESCMPPLEFGQYIGCYMPTERYGIGGDLIFIYDARTERQKMDTAVHEFGHLLHFCQTGNGNPLDLDILERCANSLLSTGQLGDECLMPGDYFHLDRRVWDKYGIETVEAVGCANLTIK